ncbi:MAG: LytTR family transcriptional regulator [Sphingopyxis sp.]|nr:LytTR family transcriptional regulator [Sphingopyxis sp.]
MDAATLSEASADAPAHDRTRGDDALARLPGPRRGRIPPVALRDRGAAELDAPLHALTQRLARAIQRVRELRQGDAARPRGNWINEFWVQHRGEMLRVDADTVDWIEAERDYMRLHVGARSWLIHQTIKELEVRLDPAAFLRIHRSKMVRRDRVRALKHHGDGAWSIDLGEAGMHRIGRTYLHDVKAIMQQG